MNTIKYDTLSLREMIQLNDEGKFVLPNFQRDFVWPADQQRRLLASFLIGLPIGSTLVLQGKKNDFASRMLCFPTHSKKVSSECFYLLDGQQRLSSFKTIFSDIYTLEKQWDAVWDKLFGKLKYRWFLQITPEESSEDIFGYDCLLFDVNKFKKYEPSQILDQIKYKQVFKTKINDWFHPAYSPKDSKGKNLVGNKKKNAIAEICSRNFLVPLYEVYKNPDDGIHFTVLEKIARIKTDELKAKVKDLDVKLGDILGWIDEDIEKKAKKGDTQAVEMAWANLQVKWTLSIVNVLSEIINQEVPRILLPADEVSRAIATFSAVNEGGTKLDLYDLIVARAARQKDLESLTQRIFKEFKRLPIKNNLSANLKSFTEHELEFEKFGIFDNSSLSSQLKNAFINNLSITTHSKIKGETLKVEHIKINKALELSHDDINKNINRCVNSLRRSFAFLLYRCGVTSLNALPYKLMLVPIAYALDEDIIWNDTGLVNKIEYWYWASLFSGSYRESQNERSIDDTKQLFLWLNGADNPFEDRAKRIFNDETYSSLKVLSGLNKDYNVPSSMDAALHHYTLSRQPKDFLYNKVNINPWDISMGNTFKHNGEEIVLKVHDHHIIPLATEKTVGQSSYSLRNDKSHILNSPLNRTYIVDKSNLDIGAKSVSDYMKIVESSSAWGHMIPDKASFERKFGEKDKEYYERFLTLRFNSFKNILTEELELLC